MNTKAIKTTGKTKCPAHLKSYRYRKQTVQEIWDTCTVTAADRAKQRTDAFFAKHLG